jgi:hypothetical protein
MSPPLEAEVARLAASLQAEREQANQALGQSLTEP